MSEFDRKDWLRALRTMNDAYILELLDEAIRRERAEAWLIALGDAQQFIYGKFADEREMKTPVLMSKVIAELQRLATKANPYSPRETKD